MLRYITPIIITFVLLASSVALAEPKPVIQTNPSAHEQNTIKLAHRTREVIRREKQREDRRKEARRENRRRELRRLEREFEIRDDEEINEDARLEALEALRNARRERRRAQARAAREGVTFPENSARQFDDFLNQAQNEFNRNNFRESEDLAKDARRGFKAIRQRIQRLGN